MSRKNSKEKEMLSLPATAEEGLRKLAFGTITDAVKLLYHPPENEKELEELETLDLYAVSELKRTKDGILEMKFYDRLKALQSLQESEHQSEEEPPLYRAIRESAEKLRMKEEAEKEDNRADP